MNYNFNMITLTALKRCKCMLQPDKGSDGKKYYVNEREEKVYLEIKGKHILAKGEFQRQKNLYKEIYIKRLEKVGEETINIKQ